MIPAGFFIESLKVSGSDKPNAEIQFTRGINFITGPSNSGKTFIFECLDFMLGASTPPKEIEESLGYDTIQLNLQDGKGIQYELKRALIGGDFTKITDGKSETLLQAHNDNKSDNVSSFLLGLSGYPKARLRADANNKTNSLTWRTICGLFVVSEIDVIEKDSPFKGSGFDATSLSSAVRFIMTGTDDSALVAQTPTKLLAAQRVGESSVYETFIADANAKIVEIRTFLEGQDTTSVEELLSNAKKQYDDANQSLIFARDQRVSVFRVQTKNSSEWQATHEALLQFETLRQHYISDLERLEFIDEGQALFEQLEAARCPTCGQLLTPEHSHKNGFDPEAYRVGTQAEAQKIKKHLIDLESTISVLTERLQSQKEQNELLVNDLAVKDKEFSEQIEPKRQFAMKELNSIIELRNKIEELSKLEVQVKVYQAHIQTLKKTKNPPPSKVSIGIPEVISRKFCVELESTLEAWQYPNPKPISFNQSTMDIVLNGKNRKSNGKGFLGVLNTAMRVSLMRYCAKNNLPHSGIIIVDTPLMNLRHEAEEAAQEIEKCFLSDLIQHEFEHQIILFDNKEAPIELRNSITYIEFSNIKPGLRKGFFDTSVIQPSKQ